MSHSSARRGERASERRGGAGSGPGGAAAGDDIQPQARARPTPRKSGLPGRGVGRCSDGRRFSGAGLARRERESGGGQRPTPRRGCPLAPQGRLRDRHYSESACHVCVVRVATAGGLKGGRAGGRAALVRGYCPRVYLSSVCVERERGRGGGGERGGDRDRTETETETESERERQTERQTERQRLRQRETD